MSGTPQYPALMPRSVPGPPVNSVGAFGGIGADINPRYPNQNRDLATNTRYATFDPRINRKPEVAPARRGNESEKNTTAWRTNGHINLVVVAEPYNDFTYVGALKVGVPFFMRKIPGSSVLSGNSMPTSDSDKLTHICVSMQMMNWLMATSPHDSPNADIDNWFFRGPIKVSVGDDVRQNIPMQFTITVFGHNPMNYHWSSNLGQYKDGLWFIATYERRRRGQKFALNPENQSFMEVGDMVGDSDSDSDYGDDARYGHGDSEDWRDDYCWQVRPWPRDDGDIVPGERYQRPPDSAMNRTISYQKSIRVNGKSRKEWETTTVRGRCWYVGHIVDPVVSRLGAPTTDDSMHNVNRSLAAAPIRMHIDPHAHHNYY